MIRTDLFGRLADFFGKAGVWGITAIVLILLVLAALALMKKRTVLLYVCLATLMFSGAAPRFGTREGSVLLRWTVMILVALTGIHGMRSPGVPMLMLGGVAAYGFAMAPLSPSFIYSIQMASLLFALTVPFAAAVTHHLRTTEDIYRLLRLYIMAAGLLVLLGLMSLPELMRSDPGVEVRIEATTTSSLFVLQGGIMLPICIWAATQPRFRRWRLYCFSVAAAIIMLSLVSGSRAGTYAGFIGCLPVLSRFGYKRLLASLGVVAVAAVLFSLVMTTMPGRSEVLYDRYIGGIGRGDYTTGRYELWIASIGDCLEEPLIGHGLGSEIAKGWGAHNAYLKAWWEVGFGGMFLFVGAFVGMGIQALRLMRSHAGREFRELGRVFLAMTLVLTSMGFVEGKLLSPSNVAIFTAVLLGAMLTRASALSREAERLAPSPALASGDEYLVPLGSGTVESL